MPTIFIFFGFIFMLDRDAVWLLLKRYGLQMMLCG